MGVEKGSFIDIDDIQSRLSVDQVAAHYGFTLPANFGGNGEQRMPCPCQECSGSQDEQAVSINLGKPHKPWKCHHGSYGCGGQGKLVNLAYCMKHGAMPPGGKVTGEAFREIARDLQRLADGEPLASSVEQTTPSPAPAVQRSTVVQVDSALQLKSNVPLSQSDNENARKLTDLDQQLVIDLESLTPKASSYARQRRYLLSETIARECRTGFMPGKTRSSLRHNWVYGVMNRQGEPLAWVGRNVKYDADQAEYVAKGRQGREPAKFRFPNASLFRRSAELYGQEWLDDPRFEPSLAEHGLILVEGFNDRIRLHELGVMSVAMMSNTLTDEQTHKLIGYAREKGGNRVGVMHDANTRGDDGAKETLWRMHQAGVDAYLIWSKAKHGGRYADREPETLTAEEWNELMQRVESGPTEST